VKISKGNWQFFPLLIHFVFSALLQHLQDVLAALQVNISKGNWQFFPPLIHFVFSALLQHLQDVLAALQHSKQQEISGTL
jgi:hypothetical protein